MKFDICPDNCCLFGSCRQDGCTALMFAAMSGHGPIVTELMKALVGAVQWTCGEMNVWRMYVRPMLCMVSDRHEKQFIYFQKRLLCQKRIVCIIAVQEAAGRSEVERKDGRKQNSEHAA